MMLPSRTFTAASPGRLDKILSTCAPDFSRSRLQQLIAGGHVRVGDAAITQPAYKVKAGDAISLALPEAAAAQAVAQDLPLDIIYEDLALLVVNKQAGMVVHPAAGNLDGTLVNALLAHCGADLSGINGVRRPGIVHRLDKDTSGLMVVAKTDAAHQALAAQFADRSLSRSYRAFVWGVPAQTSGTIDAALARSRANRMKMAVVAAARAVYIGDDVEEAGGQAPPARGKPAVTHYRVARMFGAQAAELACTLETGRTHQIRVHLASIGHGVIGDAAYGRARGARSAKALQALNEDDRAYLLNFPRQALHAAGLRLIHPSTGADLAFAAPLPADMEALLAILRKL